MTQGKGAFITLDGGEGSGKSSMISEVVSCVSAAGIEIVATRDPGGTDISHQIRAILVDAKNHGIEPMTELLLYLAARRQLTQELILPAIRAGKWVVCDRYSDSTWAYQGWTKVGTYHGHVDGMVTIRNLQLLSDTSDAGIRPNLTLLLDLPPDVGLERALSRASDLPDKEREDRFEKMDLSFHNKVREGFTRKACEEPGRIKIIHASKPIHDVAKDVRTEVSKFIECWGSK